MIADELSIEPVTSGKPQIFRGNPIPLHVDDGRKRLLFELLVEVDDKTVNKSGESCGILKRREGIAYADLNGVVKKVWPNKPVEVFVTLNDFCLFEGGEVVFKFFPIEKVIGKAAVGK